MLILDEKVLKVLCETAKMAAIRAGQYIEEQLSQKVQVLRKDGGNSLASQVLTAVDIKAQEIILQHLQPSIEDFDLGLLTEESVDDASRLDKAFFWCIDPMDGTLAFTQNRPGYAVSISLMNKEGIPIIGVAYIPDEEDCYSAIRGKGVHLNGKKFYKRTSSNSNSLAWFMDASLLQTPYFEELKIQMKAWAAKNGLTIREHHDFGAVRNAIATMNEDYGCYFKFPKKAVGGGSSWDYAATSLFFNELGLFVSDCQGDKLRLNDSETTFMHQQGVIYATDNQLLILIKQLAEALTTE